MSFGGRIFFLGIAEFGTFYLDTLLGGPLILMLEDYTTSIGAGVSPRLVTSCDLI